ncbi:MAG: hypothetical protein HOC70_15985 [Gammaproteobacteria bacterium]|jgi:hypothetical protein|nr:hypothetical protein [Gammaproteobacteria bacterium]MBT7370388.1 hypothetical protein [Gammaproteobacteria bacterium]
MTSFDELLSQRPALQGKYAAFLNAVTDNDNIPAEVLDLCRHRIEEIHGIRPVSEKMPATVSDEGRAALVVAEKIPYQHHQLLDEEVEDVKRLFGDAGCVSLLTALAFMDVTCRLNLTIGGENVD